MAAEKLKHNSRAWLRDKCQGVARHHVARVAEPQLGTSRTIERHSSIPISASRNLWDSKPRPAGDAGIITDFLRRKAGLTDAKSALDAFRADLPKMSPKMAESLDPAAVIAWFWAHLSLHARQLRQRQSWAIHHDVGVAAEPALDGRLQFAGEHTCSDFLGYMNGGVQSGNRAAAALIKVMALHK